VRNGVTLPVLAVVYDFGAAGLQEIIASARNLCQIVFVCDRSSQHVDHRMAALDGYATICDISGADQAGAAELVARHAPAGIVTFSEARIALTAAIARRCGLNYHDDATVAALTDKLAQRAALRAAGVDTTRSARVGHPDDVAGALAEVGLPAIIKPRHGAASRDTFPVTEVADAVAVLSRGGDFVLEELLVGDPRIAGERWGDRVSVESVVTDGELRTIAVTGKFTLAEPFRETGQFAPSTLPEPLADQVRELAEAAVRAVGVRSGLTHTEIKLTRTGPRVIEVNGRMGGNIGDMMRRGMGFDIVRAALQTALGERPVLPTRRRAEVIYQRYLAPPPRLTTLLALDGLDRVRGLRGVRLVEERVGPGTELDWRRGTEECLAIVYGAAADHDELYAAITAIDETVSAVYA